MKNTEEFCKTFGVERRGTASLKWDDLERVFGASDLTPLWVADMEFKTVPEAIEALKKRADHGAFGYGKVEDSYYEAFFSWQKRRHGVDLKKEELRFYTGVVGSLNALINAYTKPGEAVAICTPVYYPFSRVIRNTGRKIAECELVNTGGIYTIDFDKFEKVLAESGAKLFILCSPHNPVGRVWTPEELTRLFEICRARQLIVIADEIHQDFISPGHTFTAASVLGGGAYKDLLVTVNSGSKTFNLAGLIHSHVIIYDNKLRDRYDAAIKIIGQPEVNTMGLTATEAAFRHGEAWLTGLKAVIHENYEYLRGVFASRAPKVVISPLEGTYLVWLDLRAYIEPAKTAEFIKKTCKLAVDVGEWFIDRGGEGFIRLNIATLPAYVRLAANNIMSNIS